jgi:hypothetical protein
VCLCRRRGRQADAWHVRTCDIRCLLAGVNDAISGHVGSSMGLIGLATHVRTRDCGSLKVPWYGISTETTDTG